MNNCSFLSHATKSNDVDLVNFVLEVEEYRRNKSGQKTRRTENLNFEAWHTAAITIKEKLNVGDLILVECTARSNRDDNDFATLELIVLKFLTENATPRNRITNEKKEKNIICY